MASTPSVARAARRAEETAGCPTASRTDAGRKHPFPSGSQGRLEELEQAWPKKRLIYQQQLEREGEEIRKAKRFLG
jgi:hypothetical protein